MRVAVVLVLLCACAVTGRTVPADTNSLNVYVDPDPIPGDILAMFSAECVARRKTSIFGLIKRGMEIRCALTPVQ